MAEEAYRRYRTLLDSIVASTSAAVSTLKRNRATLSVETQFNELEQGGEGGGKVEVNSERRLRSGRTRESRVNNNKRTENYSTNAWSKVYNVLSILDENFATFAITN